MLDPLETLRKRDSRYLAAALLAQAGLGGVALGLLASVTITGPFSLGALAGATVVVSVLSACAAYLEWNREPLGESFSLPVIVGGFGLAIAMGFTGLWFIAAFQASAAIVAGFALVERYLTRNEERHKPIAGP